MGLLRGLDLHSTRNGLGPSLTARGVALVDAGGATKLYRRVNAFTALGYRTMAFRGSATTTCSRRPSSRRHSSTAAGSSSNGGPAARWRTSFS